jgi:hypothetical protein
MEEQQENVQMDTTAGVCYELDCTVYRSKLTARLCMQPSNWKPDSKSEVPISPQQELGASKTVQERDKIQSMTQRILLDCLHRCVCCYVVAGLLQASTPLLLLN